MQLKTYQQNTLNILKTFFEQCRIAGHKEAFAKITSDPDIAARLASLKSGYETWNTIPKTPRVCIKVPTGGGKTILAAHAVKIAGETWCEKEYPLVLWFVPTDTIRRQTAEALKNKRHPYREALDSQFAGKVQVFDLDEKFNITPDDIDANTCIIVSTIQSFVKEDTSKYNVYRDNEKIWDYYFSKMSPADFAGMEMRKDNSRPKYSFANLLYYHCPLMIVDEAHKVVTDLSQETLRRINPSAVIEFTATPREKNNTLYNVYASELKQEEMIKLPIVLVEHSGWENAVDEAITRRAELEKEAEKEKEYIRPIILFQAQSKDKEVTVEILRRYLIETVGLPAAQIKIVTGEQKELDGINVLDPNEPTRYIITVEALKEGWDCSFAYVLCSLANIKSDTSVEQLLGRVMRMPYAKTRKSPLLNKAYASVVSPHFEEAAVALVEKLKNKGFDEGEAAAALQRESPKVPDLNLNWNLPDDQYKPDTKLDPSSLPLSIQLDENNILHFSEATTNKDIEKVSRKIKPQEAADIIWKFNNYKQRDKTPSPASQGISFNVPRLMFKAPYSGTAQDELMFATPEIIFETFDWNIADYAVPRLEETEFKIEQSGKGFYIDIDGNRLTYRYAGNEPFLPHLSDTDVWTPSNLVYWLDSKLRQPDIPQAEMVEWLRRNIEYLTDTRKITLANLMIAKYVLLNKLSAKITVARQTVKGKAFELFQNEARKTLDFKNPFRFTEGMYDGELFYKGAYKFTKHFLGNNKIPIMDGNETGEEFQCAKAIDAEPDVQFWLRNVSQHTNSFKLPTSTDFFYPDFIAQLIDGRILVVEYKGGNLATNDDTKEKANIGEIWAKLSKGKALFMVATLKKGGKPLAEQIKEKIGN